ncbi:MAG: M20/M25/M40 family metallo-hydrolase [Clostridia bacterium]|nr:M20/M25/M40 family metallo-hydrolase [Clostridia bacterium]
MKPFVPSSLIERYFEAISHIGRPSEQEKAVSNYICSVAKELNLKYHQDQMGNVIVWKPASPGREGEPAVILQAHLDMVTVCAPHTTHDFLREPLTLQVDEEGNLRAKDTTLGADDGYGCAYMLGCLTESFSHPPLECVFTVQEENGCYGAQALDTSLISARRMIGLDVMGQEIEHTCCVSCYCSNRMILTAHPRMEKREGLLVKARLTGIQPVRSVMIVHPERGNAIKLLTRLLRKLPRELYMIEMRGGEAENYNPVACETSFLMPRETAEAEVREALERELKQIDFEINEGKQELKLELEFSPQEREAVSWEETLRLLRMIDLLPSDTQEIHPKEDRMIAINNIGIVDWQGEAFTLTISDRGQNRGCLEGIERRVADLCELCGAVFRQEVRYAPWDYRPDSPLLLATAKLMKEYYGQEMVENICPGGLELCDFLPGLPGLDCVMFAPIGDECHSTMEWMNLASFNRVYGFLKELLGRI